MNTPFNIYRFLTFILLAIQSNKIIMANAGGIKHYCTHALARRPCPSGDACKFIHGMVPENVTTISKNALRLIIQLGVNYCKDKKINYTECIPMSELNTDVKDMLDLVSKSSGQQMLLDDFQSGKSRPSSGGPSRPNSGRGKPFHPRVVELRQSPPPYGSSVQGQSRGPSPQIEGEPDFASLHNYSERTKADSQSEDQALHPRSADQALHPRSAEGSPSGSPALQPERKDNTRFVGLNRSDLDRMPMLETGGTRTSDLSFGGTRTSDLSFGGTRTSDLSFGGTVKVSGSSRSWRARNEPCKNMLERGTCHWGDQCKWQH